MADQGLYDKSTQGARQSGDYVRINRAFASNPSGRADYKIDVDDFLEPEQTLIQANSNSISTLSDRVTVVESLINKVTRVTDNGNFEVTQPANSELIEIGFINKSGSPIVKAGITDGGDELVYEKTISDSSITSMNNYTDTARTLYFKVASGSVGTVILYRTNYFNL